MRIRYLTPLIWINLVACQSYVGNVVPQKGPTMEQVYEAVEPSRTAEPKPAKPLAQESTTALAAEEPKSATLENTFPFRKLPNPELTMYVYPHVAGNAQIPIPGYATVFHVYERDPYSVLQS